MLNRLDMNNNHVDHAHCYSFMMNDISGYTKLNRTRDYKFHLRSNQIRRIKSGVIFQPSSGYNVNKLDCIEKYI